MEPFCWRQLTTVPQADGPSVATAERYQHARSLAVGVVPVPAIGKTHELANNVMFIGWRKRRPRDLGIAS